MEEIRVRFAPSPTGFLHIGGARTALYNWLIARQKKGKMILRIEDTDMERSTDESIQAILDGMKWLGLDWDEGPEKEGEFGPYFQSQRLEIYTTHLDKLIEEKKAYRCFCSAEELNEHKEKAKQNKETYRYNRKCMNLLEEEIKKNLDDKKPYVIRLINPEETEIKFLDLIKGEIRVPANTIDDFIICRSDGYPVYNFAVVCDDAGMKINHVIRGDDHISNTPKQILIYKALDLPIPNFAHVPMILGEDKTRLSKRHGATAVQQYNEEGYLPEAMRNYLVRLGWGYDDSQEVFSTDELIEKFSLEKVSKNPAVFNLKKLEWLNNHYIQQLSLEERTEAVLPFLKKEGLIDDTYISENREFLKKIVEIVGDRLKILKEISLHTDFFFKDEISISDDVKEKLFSKTNFTDTYEKIISALNSCQNWTHDDLLKCLEEVSAQIDIKRKDYFQVIRAGLTGKLFSPDLLSIMLLIGKEKTINRLESAKNSCT